MPRPAALFLAVTAVLLLWLRGGVAEEPRPVVLELLLAVDCSSSVSDAEFALQMGGIAQAFDDPTVQAAIEQAGAAGIAVALLQWSSLRSQVMAVDWTLITGAEGARAFAERVRRSPRYMGGGATAMSGALALATASIESNAFAGERKVIDVSGDGRANEGQSPAIPRALANRLGITINGLAILNEEPGLAGYYQSWVVGGPGSFLITADDYHDFIDAIRRKLIFEIRGAPIAERPATVQGARR